VHEQTLAREIKGAVDTVGEILDVKSVRLRITNFGQEGTRGNRRGLRGPPRKEMREVN